VSIESLETLLPYPILFESQQATGIQSIFEATYLNVGICGFPD
jgi:hypothetical protein